MKLIAVGYGIEAVILLVLGFLGIVYGMGSLMGYVTTNPLGIWLVSLVAIGTGIFELFLAWALMELEAWAFWLAVILNAMSIGLISIFSIVNIIILLYLIWIHEEFLD